MMPDEIQGLERQEATLASDIAALREIIAERSPIPAWPLLHLLIRSALFALGIKDASIAELEAENKRLLEALTRVKQRAGGWTAPGHFCDHREAMQDCYDIARAALSGEGK